MEIESRLGRSTNFLVGHRVRCGRARTGEHASDTVKSNLQFSVGRPSWCAIAWKGTPGGERGDEPAFSEPIGNGAPAFGHG